MITAELNPKKRKNCDACGDEKKLTRLTLDSTGENGYTSSIYICKSCMMEMVNKFDEVQEGLR